MELVREEEELVAQLPSHFPFRVVTSGEKGRALVTTRKIRPEETVLTDSAILLGPASNSVCIVCCCGGGTVLTGCPHCRHPLCASCREAVSHSEDECQALVRLGYTKDIYNVILPVRFALLRCRDELMFEWLLQYMDHNQERNAVCAEMARSTERMAAMVAAAMPGVSEDLAWKIIGILFTNCFEFNLAHIEARALYPLVSLINHSCIPNLRHTNLLNQVCGPGEVEGEIVVMRLEAQRTIPQDTELTIRYNSYMMSILQRRQFLTEQWHFTCQCPRCKDPTEFGTLTSSLPCPSCPSGQLLPCHSSSLPSLPSPWACCSCGHLTPETEVAREEARLLHLATCRPSPYNIRSCLEQLHSLSKVLHSNHFILMDLKQKFLFAFSINMKKVRDLSAEQRTKLGPLFLAQEKYCRQLLAYHEVLDPGTSGIKTKLLLELRKVLLLQCRVLSDSPDCSRDQLAAKLQELGGLSSLVCERVPL